MTQVQEIFAEQEVNWPTRLLHDSHDPLEFPGMQEARNAGASFSMSIPGLLLSCLPDHSDLSTHGIFQGTAPFKLPSAVLLCLCVICAPSLPNFVSGSARTRSSSAAPRTRRSMP